MKHFKNVALLLVATVMVFGCSKYDDTELRNDISDIRSRVEKLEAWCTTANTQIAALQGLIEALQANDYVTGVVPVMEGTKEVGYIISFTKSESITILHGKDGAKGADGITPLIGATKDTDGHYYWTVKLGTAAATWLLDADGNQIRTTGDKGDTGADGKPGMPGADGKPGHTPELSIEKEGDRYYWKVDGEWLEDAAGEKIPATGDKGENGAAGADGAQGEKGDSFFESITPDATKGTVKVELADGTTFTLPMLATSVSFDAYTPLQIAATGTETVVTVTLPESLKKADFAAFKASITNVAGTNTAITRATPTTEKWTVVVTPPTFKEDGTLKDQPTVKVTAPATATEGETALLEVTVVDTKGSQSSSTRVLFYDGRVPVTSVSLDKTTLALEVGKTEALTATVTPTSATDKTVTWTSSNTTVATVSGAGLVTAVAAGTAIITVTTTNGSKTATCTVTVTNIDVTGITLANATVAIGGKATLTPMITPNDATIKTVTWSSSDAAVATVSDAGEVTGVKAGTATITATSTSNTAVKGTCTVTVAAGPFLVWAEGNLISDGNGGCAIGSKTDGGLYFQFGSLIGWSTTDPLAIVVKPSGYTGSESWNNDWISDPTTDNATAGTGDPCRYYLKNDWRLPTKEEYAKLFNNVTDGKYANSGGWSWNGTSSSATNTALDLTFPAPGYRSSNGTLSTLAYGFYWSSSSFDATKRHLLYFSDAGVYPTNSATQPSGFSVRCVKLQNP